MNWELLHKEERRIRGCEEVAVVLGARPLDISISWGTN